MFLDTIVAKKKLEVEALAERFSLREAERQIGALAPCKGFARALTAGRKRALGLIAEVKKASPSKGMIRADFDPVRLAAAYAAHGADCISVLTDVDFFQGANAYLTAVRAAVSVPLLRKDFTIDERQIYEARLIGADAILLIAAILNDEQLARFHTLAQALGLDVLVEVHDEEELKRVLELNQATLIGVNNRDLRTFVTDLETTARLQALMPEGMALISESGISTPADVAFVTQAGAQGLLIGEHFMRQPDPGVAIDELLGPVSG